MEKLKGFQKKYLKALAHAMKPVVFIGRNGVTPNVIQAVDDALDKHELIKLKFIDFKEKSEKTEIIGEIEDATTSEMVGMVGHIALFYRRQIDPDKRTITVPERQAK